MQSLILNILSICTVSISIFSANVKLHSTSKEMAPFGVVYQGTIFPKMGSGKLLDLKPTRIKFWYCSSMNKIIEIQIYIDNQLKVLIKRLVLTRTRTTEIDDVVCVNNVIWTVGCERVRGAKAKWWDSCWQTRDKGGWVFVTTSKEAGSPSK